jgi:hypothetical protein
LIGLINAFDDLLFHGPKWANFCDAIPSCTFVGSAADGFVTFLELRHEELFGKGGKFDTSPGIVFHRCSSLVVDDAENSTRLGCVVRDGVVVFCSERFVAGKTHQGVTISWHKSDFIFADFFHQETGVLRVHGGASTEATFDAHVDEAVTFGQSFEKFWRGEKGTDLTVFDNGVSLINYVLHVGFGLIIMLVLDETFYPAWVEINKVTGAATDVGQVFNGKTKAAWASRPDHQPVVVAWEVVIIEIIGKFRVIDFVVLPANALLGHTCCASSFEDAEGSAAVGLTFRTPDFGLEVAKVLVLKIGKPGREIFKSVDFVHWIPVLFAGPIEPELTAGFRVEMPGNDFFYVSVESFFGLLNFVFHFCRMLKG